MRKLVANQVFMPALLLVGGLALAACDDQGGQQGHQQGQGMQQQGQLQQGQQQGQGMQQQGQLQQGQQQQGGNY